MVSLAIARSSSSPDLSNIALCLEVFDPDTAHGLRYLAVSERRLTARNIDAAQDVEHQHRIVDAAVQELAADAGDGFVARSVNNRIRQNPVPLFQRLALALTAAVDWLLFDNQLDQPLRRRDNVALIFPLIRDSIWMNARRQHDVAAIAANIQAGGDNARAIANIAAH